jgi:hypothetical protein
MKSRERLPGALLVYRGGDSRKTPFFLAFGYRCPSGGIKVNFGVSDAIEIGGRTQFM